MNWRQAQTMHTGKAGSSWLSDDPQTLRDCFHHQPLLYPIPPPTTPCWKVFGRRWRRGLAKSYRVICLLRRRTTSGRRGGKEDEETKDRGLWRKWWRTERGLALSTFNDWSICCVAWTRNWWNFILFNREEKKFEWIFWSSRFPFFFFCSVQRNDPSIRIIWLLKDRILFVYVYPWRFLISLHAAI